MRLSLVASCTATMSIGKFLVCMVKHGLTGRDGVSSGFVSAAVLDSFNDFLGVDFLFWHE